MARTKQTASRRLVGTTVARTHAIAKESKLATRLHNELKKHVQSGSGVNFAINNVHGGQTIYGVIVGPPQTAWSGGVFRLAIDIPDNYPFQPPSCKFTTDVFHPNVDTDNRPHLDILDKAWTPAFTIEKLLIAVRSMLANPDTDPTRVVNMHALRMSPSDSHVK